MYGMSFCTHEFVNDLAGPIRCCPFCSATGHLTFRELSPVRYGIQCRTCGASIPAIHPTSQAAILVWNQRRGLASSGGKATRGKCSRRKLAAARNNLKKARQVRQVNRLRNGAEAAFKALQPHRQREREWIEAQLAESRAELVDLEPLIKKDPQLSELLGLLNSRQGQSASADRHQEDFRTCPPGDFVLPTKTT
jgi:Restriction alleviation protein Lar